MDNRTNVNFNIHQITTNTNTNRYRYSNSNNKNKHNRDKYNDDIDADIDVEQQKIYEHALYPFPTRKIQRLKQEINMISGSMLRKRYSGGSAGH